MKITTEPSTEDVLDELRAIVDAHQAGDDVAGVLDEVGAALRRARARVRAAARKVAELAGKQEGSGPVGKPAEQPTSAPAATPASPAAMEGQDRPDATGPVRPSTALRPAEAPGARDRTSEIRTAAPSTAHVPVVRTGRAPDMPGAPRDTLSGLARWPWLRPLVALLVVLAAAILGPTAGVLPALVAAVVLVLAAAALPLLVGRVVRRGHRTRDDRPPGRT